MIVTTEGKPGEGMSFRSWENHRFQDRFRQIRKKLKLTQITMAEHLGVSLRTVQRFENGTTPPAADVLERVASLGVDLHWLITGISADNPGCTQVKAGVVFFAFRSERYHQIVETLQQAGMTAADLHFIMEHHLRGIVDGLNHLNQKPF